MAREEEIRQVAYGLWEAEGRTEGRDLAHWLEAERTWQQREAQQPFAKPLEEEPATGQRGNPLEPAKAAKKSPRPRTPRPRRQ